MKNRDWCDYRFDTHKWIDLAGADYLTDYDDISVIFLGPITSPKVTTLTSFFAKFGGEGWLHGVDRLD